MRYANLVKTIEEIRLANFQLLRELRSRGRPVYLSNPEFAKITGLSAVYVWQLNEGKRTSIDSKAARKIEETANIEPGWMDNDHGLIAAVRAESKWPFAAVTPNDWKLVGEALQQEIEDRLVGAVARLKRPRDPSTGADLMDRLPQHLGAPLQEDFDDEERPATGHRGKGK